MKTYKNRKAVLCIGLLGLLIFNILSSCANTRQKLDWWPTWCPNRQELGCTKGQMTKQWNQSSFCSKVCCCCMCIACTPVVPTLIGAGVIWVFFRGSGGVIKDIKVSRDTTSMRMMDGNNTLNLTIGALSGAPNLNNSLALEQLGETKIKFIHDSIKNFEWSDGNTTKKQPLHRNSRKAKRQTRLLNRIRQDHAKKASGPWFGI